MTFAEVPYVWVLVYIIQAMEPYQGGLALVKHGSTYESLEDCQHVVRTIDWSKDPQIISARVGCVRFDFMMDYERDR